MTNEQAFLEQIRANQGIIKKLVGLYARQEEDRKDLYQEILLQTWRAFPKFRGDAKFSTWLYRVSLNTILTANRKPQHTDYRESLPEDLGDTAPSALMLEESEALRRAMRTLPDAERAIISLHLDGFTNPEIADIMGITINHTGVKLHRIKQLLTKQLQPR